MMLIELVGPEGAKSPTKRTGTGFIQAAAGGGRRTGLSAFATDAGPAEPVVARSTRARVVHKPAPAA